MSASRSRAGETVYTTRGADCHLPSRHGVPRNGGGRPGETAPRLVSNAALMAPDPARLINAILYGAPGARFDDHAWPTMSGLKRDDGLDDEQIAPLCT